jgi:hypothetical protein
VAASDALRYLEVGRRFRIKSNIDLPMAERLVEELAHLGAVATIIDVKTGNVVKSERHRRPAQAGAPLSAPPPLADATPPPLPMTGATLPARPPLHPPPPSRAAAPFESGLSAAMRGGGMGEVPLGALDALGSAQLSSLDGSEDTVPAPPPSVATPVAPPLSASPHDPFGAPKDEEAPLELDLAAAPPPPRGRLADPVLGEEDPTLAVPPAVGTAQAIPAPRAPGRATGASFGGTAVAPASRMGIAGYVSGSPRRALLAGLALALLFGYLPASLYASSATDSKYALIRRDVESAQSGSLTLTDWQELPRIRQAAVARMESAQGRIAVITFMLWVICAGGVLALWYRIVIPRLPVPLAPSSW